MIQKCNFVELTSTLPMRLPDICQNTEENEIRIPSRETSEKSFKISEKVHYSKEFNDDDIDKNKQEAYSYGDIHIDGVRLIPDIDVKDIGNVIQEYSDNDDDGFKKEYEVHVNSV